MPQRIEVPGMGVVEFPDGMSDAQIVAAIQQNMAPQQSERGVSDTALGMGKALGSGVVRGGAMMGGMSGDIAKAMRSAVPALEAAGVSTELPEHLQKERNRPIIGSKEVMGGIDRATGLPITSYQPQNTAEKYAQRVGEFTPSAVMGGGGILRGAIGAGLGSEAAGQATEGTKWEGAARVAGAMGGSVAPSLARRAVTPFPTSPERAQAVQNLRNEGVTDITAGQATGRDRLRYFEAERGAGNRLAESAGEQFTSAALRRVGENANRATPEVIDRAFTRIGQQFDDLAARNQAVVDQPFMRSLIGARDEYNSLVAQPNRTPAVDNFFQEIGNASTRNGGTLPGDVYQSLRSRMERAARGMGNNPEAMHAVRNMREALDDAMERSMVAAGNQADAAAWQEARNQYRNLLVIERAATGAGENAALGMISPAQLRGATVNQNRRSYARGTSELGNLARSGVAVMSPLPNSGTPGRTLAQNLGTGTSAVVGALLGGGAGAGMGPFGAGIGGAVGAAAGAAAPSAVGHALTSSPVRRYLSNQALPPNANAIDPRTAALINALIAERFNHAPQLTAR